LCPYRKGREIRKDMAINNVKSIPVIAGAREELKGLGNSEDALLN
jgi:hypothetical protein